MDTFTIRRVAHDLAKFQRLTEQLLAAHARPLFPIGVAHGAPPLQVRGTALLARIVDLAEGALVLSRRDRQGDLGILARSLFEHAVTFAWLAGPTDTSERLRRLLLWQYDDDLARLRVDRELKELDGEPLLPPETRAELEADVVELRTELGQPKMPGYADRAKVVENEWSDRLGVPFGQMYSVLYRTTSAVAHPTQAGLNLVISRDPEQSIVHLEGPGGAPTLRLVPLFVVMGLLVSAHTFARPTLEDAEAALTELLEALRAPDE